MIRKQKSLVILCVCNFLSLYFGLVLIIYFLQHRNVLKYFVLKCGTVESPCSLRSVVRKLRFGKKFSLLSRGVFGVCSEVYLKGQRVISTNMIFELPGNKIPSKIVLYK